MSERVDNPPPWTSWTRRTWVVFWVSVAVVVLLLAGLAVGLKARSLDEDYGPISTGSFGGTGGTPGVGHDRYGNARLLTTGNRTTHVFGSLANGGTHSVVVTGIDPDDVTVTAQWAPVPDENGATIPDSKAHWRDFPATIGARTEVQMRYTIRRPPRCQDARTNPRGGEYWSDRHVVRWESLLGEHATTIGGLLDLEIQIC